VSLALKSPRVPGSVEIGGIDRRLPTARSYWSPSFQNVNKHFGAIDKLKPTSDRMMREIRDTFTAL